MKTYIQSGAAITVAAAAVTVAGVGVLIGALFGIAGSSVAIGAQVTLEMQGVFNHAKVAADDIAVGDKLYWNAATSEVTSTVATNKLIGVAVEAAGAATTTVVIRLSGQV